MNIPKFNPVKNPVYLKVSERAAVQFTDHMTSTAVCKQNQDTDCVVTTESHERHSL